MINKKLQFNAIFRPEKEGGFTVLVPSLPGCVSYGKDLNEAKAMIIDAIKGYLFAMKKRGVSVETDANSFISTIDMSAGKVYA